MNTAHEYIIFEVEKHDQRLSSLYWEKVALFVTIEEAKKFLAEASNHDPLYDYRIAKIQREILFRP